MLNCFLPQIHRLIILLKIICESVDIFSSLFVICLNQDCLILILFHLTTKEHKVIAQRAQSFVNFKFAKCTVLKHFIYKCKIKDWQFYFTLFKYSTSLLTANALWLILFFSDKSISAKLVP